METYAERLSWAISIQKPKTDFSKLARAVSQLVGEAITPQSMQYLCAHQNNATGSKHTPAIAHVLGISALWLANNEGGPFDGKERPEDAVGDDFTKGRLPLISWVQAGEWGETIDNFSVGDAEDWLGCPFKHGPNAFILRVVGQSMYNPGGDRSYNDGEFIAVDPSREALHGSMVVVRLDDSHTATFKQLLVEPDGTMMLKALNPGWPEPIIKVNGNATICGVVIGKWIDEG